MYQTYEQKVTHHVGKVNNTDARCAILMAQNPHNPAMTLIVDTNALPPRLHDALMGVLEKEGQQSASLANVLQRRIFSDTGQDLLTSLHLGNHIQSVPVENVTLFPTPNNPIPLSQVVNQSMHSSMDQDPQAMTPPMDRTAYHDTAAQNSEGFNSYTHNRASDKYEEMSEMASNMLQEAASLDEAARKKREEAYKLSPSMRQEMQKVPQSHTEAKTTHEPSLNPSPISDTNTPNQEPSMSLAQLTDMMEAGINNPNVNISSDNNNPNVNISVDNQPDPDYTPDPTVLEALADAMDSNESNRT